VEVEVEGCLVLKVDHRRRITACPEERLLELPIQV